MVKLSNHDKELQHELSIIGIFTKNDCLSKGKEKEIGTLMTKRMARERGEENLHI